MTRRWSGGMAIACALFIAGVAGPAAEVQASLPPLPSSMPDDDGKAGYGDAPLPESVSGVADNPFVTDARADARMDAGMQVGAGDGADEGADEGLNLGNPTAVGASPGFDARVASALSPDDFAQEEGDAMPRGARASGGSAARERTDVARRPQRDDGERSPATGAEPLEGPPTPLPVLRRLGSGSTDPASRPGTPAPTKPADNRPITLNFQHAEIAAVLNAFARFTGLNIVASERVRGFVSLHLDKVPWRDAFDTLLDVGNLAMERRGSVIWVAPVAELAAREKQRYETHARAADLEPLASRTFDLYYAKAEDVRKLLTGSGAQRVLSKRGSASADSRTNLLFVTDLAARLDQIAQLLDAIDRPTRQVMIEARIVEGEEGFSRNLGVRLKLAATREGQPTGFVSGKDDTLFDLSAHPISGFDAATAGLTLFVAQATRLLNIELSALEAEGHGKTVSSPRVVTADRIKAIVEQGQELPYQAKVGQGVSGVQFRRASLKLEVEPQVTPTGRVVLDLDVAKDTVGEETAAGPAINTKHVRTRVEVEDGGTVSIGGIYANDDRDDVTEVPLLGKIPVLGGLFRHRAHRRQRSELVIFITPRVVASELTDG